MQNLKTIYAQFNEVLDAYDKAANEVNKASSECIKSIILNKDSYTPSLSDAEMTIVEQIYTNMVKAIEKGEKTLYVNHCAISGIVLDALFFKGDFELLDILRESEPFCLLSSTAKDEIKAILELFNIESVNQSNLICNDLFRFYTMYQLPNREPIQSLNRKYNGVIIP